jgi:hypothetical protein
VASARERTHERVVVFHVVLEIGVLDEHVFSGRRGEAGADGPAFLVFKNYDAAFAYNGATSYALAISLLADRLKGQPGLRTPWPTDDPGLSRAQRRELQVLLLKRGYDIGEADGAIGAKTRAAIADLQRRNGLSEDGRPGQRILKLLRGG